MKTLLAVGGWNHGSTLFSEMVSTEAGIQQFATNSLNFVAQYGFDGIDLDWEYPAKTTVDISPPEDHENFKRKAYIQYVPLYERACYGHTYALSMGL